MSRHFLVIKNIRLTKYQLFKLTQIAAVVAELIIGAILQTCSGNVILDIL